MAEPGHRGAYREGSPPDQSEGATPAEHPIDPASLREGYEITDASGGALAWVMLVGAGIMAASVAVLFVVIAYFHREAADHPPLTALQRAVITPPKPNLQADPFRDIAAARQHEAELLTGFAYLDADHKRARIPIDRAEALVVGKSLDPRP